MRLTEYQPIPVEVAKDIAELFNKGFVVIIADDAAFDCTQITTYGVTAQDKVQAVNMAEGINKLLGLGEKFEAFEDFRAVTAAEYQVEIERLTAERNRLEGLLNEHRLVIEGEAPWLKRARALLPFARWAGKNTLEGLVTELEEARQLIKKPESGREGGPAA